MSIGEAQPHDSKPKPPPSRDALWLGIVFAVTLLGVAVLLTIRGLPGSSVGSTGPVPSGPALRVDPNEPPATKPVEQKSESPFSPFPPGLPKLDSTPLPDPTPVRVVDNSAAELRARVRAKVLALQQVGREIREALGVAEKNSVEWAKQSADLLTNEVGRKVASQPDLVERFDAFLSDSAEQPLTPAIIGTWRERLTELLKPLVLPADDAREVSMPGSDLEPDLLKLQREIAERGKVTRENVAGLTALVAAARDVKPGERTLQQAIATLAAERRQKLDDAKVAGRRKADETAREAVEKGEQTKRAAEIALQVAEKNAEAARLKKAADDATEAVARKQRIAKNKNAISQYLGPFTTPGYAQPVQMPGTFLDVTKTKDKKPMSLAGLRKIGALDDNERGVQKLYRAASSFSNDRPLWSEQYNHELAIKAHQLLLDLGEDLVLEGILSP